MILAIDTGTNTGWATWDGSALRSGVWALQGKGNTHRTRWMNLWGHLEDVRLLGQVTTLVYERIDRHPRPRPANAPKGWQSGDNVKAAHVYGGWVAILEMWAEARGVEIECLPSPTVKAHATGKGNCGKDPMMAAASLKWPEQKVHNDNQADALWLLDAFRVKHER